VSLPALAAIVIVWLALGYRVYGRFIARQYSLDDRAATPAVTLNDGVDFVPAGRFYLLGQHFSAIAAAGPIAGPILACQLFGWLPCILWIALGVVFIGAVHDFSSLIASVRHRARSVAEIVREYLGERAWLAMMAFIWVALVYVIVAFTDITANTFVGQSEELAGGTFTFNPGGAVAAASVLYLLLAILMGAVQRLWDPPLWLLTVIFVPATLGAVWLGTELSTWLIFDARVWGVVILLYCLAASVTPMWLLLQPRGYLGGFVLYLALFVGVVGIFFGGFTVKQPAFITWHAPGMTGSLFPFLFVTIACGACSGFHGLVCSGTTSKQIARESDCSPVGYGGMLLEGFVALIALATIMIVSSDQVANRAPGVIYGEGIGRFLTVMIGEQHLRFAITFGAMAFSTFVFDTLDVSARLGRYILEELLRPRGVATKIVATTLTVAVPLVFIVIGGESTYRVFWTLFGSSNQLLAALTLLAITTWLRATGRRYWYVLLPTLFVMTITIWALVIQARAGLTALGLNAATMNAVVATVLIALAIVLVREAIRVFRRVPAVEPPRGG
jgi:carbon starvation protein